MFISVWNREVTPGQIIKVRIVFPELATLNYNYNLLEHYVHGVADKAWRNCAADFPCAALPFAPMPNDRNPDFYCLPCQLQFLPVTNRFNYWEHWSSHNLVPRDNLNYISLQKSWQTAGPQKPAYMESYLVSILLILLSNLDIHIRQEKLFGEATVSAGVKITFWILKYFVNSVLVVIKYSVSVYWTRLWPFTPIGNSQKELTYGSRVNTWSFSTAKGIIYCKQLALFFFS